MNSSEQQSQTSPLHGRTPSSVSRRPAVPRTSTRGPLEGDDPLTASISTPSPPRQSERLSTTAPTTPSRSPAPQVTVIERPKKDFAYLQRLDIFHNLNDNDIPAPFHESPNFSTQGLSIQDCFSKGRFRTAAALAADQLTTYIDRTDHAAIFAMLYLRLAALQLAGFHDLAAQESKVLQDLNDPFYLDPSSGKHLAPWELRVLAVRLQALGFSDWRRGIMGYYELAREARIEYGRANSESTKREWQEKLYDLGMRVANALLEMGDSETALRHLKTLPNSNSTQMKTRLALVYIRLGDIHSARHCVQSNSETQDVRVVEALCKMADGDYDEAAEQWQLLRNSANPESLDVINQNLALCFMYTGAIAQARDLFEEILSSSSVNRSVTFNLATIHELCMDDAIQKKLEMSRKIASMPQRSTGWDYSSSDFKM